MVGGVAGCQGAALTRRTLQVFLGGELVGELLAWAGAICVSPMCGADEWVDGWMGWREGGRGLGS